MNVKVDGCNGSATTFRDTLALGAPPELVPDGPLAVSAPDPTWTVTLRPPDEAPPPPMLGTPVILPGRRLEIPPAPVMKRLVGIGKPLTELADPPPPPPLPKDPDADELAPGNGVTNDKPLVVRTMIPRFEFAMSARSSRMQSFRLGRNIKWLFILNVHEVRSGGIPRLPVHNGLTSQSGVIPLCHHRDFVGVEQGERHAIFVSSRLQVNDRAGRRSLWITITAGNQVNFS